MRNLRPLLAVDAGTYRIRLARLGRDEVHEDLNCLAVGPDEHPERRAAPRRNGARLVLAVGETALSTGGTGPAVEIGWPFAGGVVGDQVFAGQDLGVGADQRGRCPQLVRRIRHEPPLGVEGLPDGDQRTTRDQKRHRRSAEQSDESDQGDDRDETLRLGIVERQDESSLHESDGRTAV